MTRIAATSSRRRVSAFCDGRFDAVIDSEFPLAEAGAAQQKMLTSDFFGKILLAALTPWPTARIPS